MAIERTPDPTAIRADVEIVQTPSGPRPTGVADALAYFADLVASGERVVTVASSDRLNTYDVLLESLSWPIGELPSRVTMHPRDAAMLAVARILQGLVWHSQVLNALLDDPAAGPTIIPHKLDKVRLEWPEWDSPEIPVNYALVTAGQGAAWDPAIRQPRLVTESLGVYGPGSILRYLGEYTIPIQIVTWFADRQVRRGFEARVCAALASGREQDIFARRVVVPEYFDQVVRLELGESTRPDDSVQAAQNRWPLEIMVQAEVPHVELVRAPISVASAAADAVVDGAG